MKGKAPTPVILLFLKAPAPGRVKTRLARDLGQHRACTIYRQMVEHQLASLPAGWPVEIHFAPASAALTFARWLGEHFSYFPQADGDLGNRLRTATAGAFEKEHRNVILIGGDCPGLDAAALEKCARFLENGADVVIGPAADGGYYLLGLSRLVESLFEGIAWSGPDVAMTTAERAAAAGLRLEWLEEKEDVDDLASYRRARASGYFSAGAPHGA